MLQYGRKDHCCTQRKVGGCVGGTTALQYAVVPSNFLNVLFYGGVVYGTTCMYMNVCMYTCTCEASCTCMYMYM